jgi:CRISPR-associated exonuclease Cas4
MMPPRSDPLFWLAAGVLLAGLLMILSAWRMRRVRGLSSGRTLALDDVTLYSPYYALRGRPDRIVRAGGTVIPEEWKSAKRLWPGHIAQMGVYFLLIEERFGVRPPYGYVVLGTGERRRIANDEKLRAWVLDLSSRIRDARRRLLEPTRPRPRPAQCRACGQRDNCSERVA